MAYIPSTNCTLDNERLKDNGGGSYWKELLDRIRDIRSSEKVIYEYSKIFIVCE